MHRPLCRRPLLLLAASFPTLAAAPALHAAALDPLAYASLGTLNDTTTNGTFTANGTAAPTLVIGSTTYTGVYQAQGSGLPAIAVFDFSGVTLAAGFTLGGTTSVPVALLSQGSMTIGGTINANGFGGGAGGAGTPANSGAAGSVGKGAGGGPGGVGGAGYGGSGGGYGGVGGSAPFSISGGPGYGNLAASLQGGSGGGGGSSYTPADNGSQGGSGGAGGGALELGATNALTVAAGANVTATGTAGGTADNNAGAGGGGSGGGLFLHAGALSLAGSLAANGGAYGADSNGANIYGGAPGGGGRVLLSLPSFVVGTSVVPGSAVNVTSGAYSGYGSQGGVGVAGLTVDTTTVPTGQTLSVTGGNLTGTPLAFTSNLVNVQSGGTFANTGGYTNPAGAEVALNAVDARLTGGTFTNAGLLDGSAGRVEATVANVAGGQIRAAAGSDLVFTGAGNTNAGTINLLGGTTDFRADLTNSGTISGHGTLATGTGLTNTGTVAFSQNSDVLGTVTNNSGGQLTTTGGAVVTYENNVANNSGATVKTAVNSTTVFLGNITGAGAYAGTGTVDFEGNVSFSGNAVDMRGEQLLSQWSSRSSMAVSSRRWLFRRRARALAAT